jgi:hypothetical protein
MSSSDDEIRDLAGAVVNLTRRALAEYSPIVDSLVLGRSLDVGDIERTLDGLLDFCFDPEVLRLFRRLCLYYSRIDPAATEAYVVAYHQLCDHDGEQPP